MLRKSKFAKPGCRYCSGTGIDGYRKGVPLVCRCVKKALEKKEHQEAEERFLNDLTISTWIRRLP